MKNKEEILNFISALAGAYQAFSHCSSKHIRSLGLTPTQFDIIATLGNTKGMTCKDLGDKTLVTKGTLTGVIDRLEKINILERVPTEDRRCWIVRLTAKGEKLFAKVFPEHLVYLEKAFAKIKTKELISLTEQINSFNKAIEK